MKLKLLAFAAIFSFCISNAFADTRYIKTVEAEFEDIFADLEDAIVNAGLVVEHTGHIGRMLERTSGAVDGGKLPYTQAKYMQFCSAKMTFEAASADPRNMSMCPFVVFAYQTPDDTEKVSVGYRSPDFGSIPADDPLSMKIHGFLKSIIDTATEGY